jgi:uncharacterized RDD family membrane protein YckC
MKKEIIEIETPEKIVFTYAVSSTGTRIFSYTIDVIIQFLTIVILIIIVYAVSGFNLANELRYNVSGLLVAFLYLVYFFIQWGYYILFEVIMGGQSPGKKLMKIRVIRTNGEPLDFATIVLRNLLRVVDAFPFYHLIGGLVSIVDKLSRRVGDIVADTIVVKEMEFNLKEPDFRTVFRTLIQREKFSLLHKKLNEEQLYILRRFLNEKNSLTEEKQNEIALRLAKSVKKRLEIKEEIREPIDFIEKIYRAHTDEDKE